MGHAVAPDELAFVLADYKGGATFASLDVLPHTSAVITNLADELPLVDRMQASLAGEMVRRQELLRDAGNYVSLFEYEKARLAGEPGVTKLAAEKEQLQAKLNDAIGRVMSTS